MVQWLGLHTFTAEGASSIPGQGAEIPQATLQQKKKKKVIDTNLHLSLSLKM